MSQGMVCVRMLGSPRRGAVGEAMRRPRRRPRGRPTTGPHRQPARGAAYREGASKRAGLIPSAARVLAR